METKSRQRAQAEKRATDIIQNPPANFCAAHNESTSERCLFNFSKRDLGKSDVDAERQARRLYDSFMTRCFRCRSGMRGQSSQRKNAA